MWYMIRNLRCIVTIVSVLANSKTHNAFLFTVNAIFLHEYPLAVEPGSTPRPLVQKKNWMNSLAIDMLLSAVSVLVVAQSSSEFPEGLMNNPVCSNHNVIVMKYKLQHKKKVHKSELSNSKWAVNKLKEEREIEKYSNEIK